MKTVYLFIIAAILFLTGCEKKPQQQLTPWGTAMEQDPDSTVDNYHLNEIIDNGEIIMLTLNGPDNYFDYHGRGMGIQYLMCEKFAQKIGVSLRVEVCKDTTEVIKRLKAGEGDIAALYLPRTVTGVKFCGVRDAKRGTSWAVANDNTALADTLNRWYRPGIAEQVRKEQDWALSWHSVERHVYSPMLNRSEGIISEYDHLFQKYAPVARQDWRLMAAQCYQESTFDPHARSWVGACGLMQIMPSTADQLGLPRSALYDPEQNIAAAAKYLSQIDQKFHDIPSRMERINFVLACYNGGYNHVRDAMALARKNGRNAHQWVEVREYVLGLSLPKYYNDPVVKSGYMRGSETVDYVDRIQARWREYRGVAKGGFVGSFGGGMMPQRATKKYKYHI